jgi:uncharacterized protein YijF (DUF1287 family)
VIRYLFIAAILTPAIVFAQDSTAPAGRLLQGASEQIGKTIRYDPSYEALAFPGGDVPIERGVCTDVIVRAYRTIGVDLQLLVNQDMRQSFGAYPKLWRLSRPDPNIDHRRVPNLVVFFSRHGKTLRVSREKGDYKPGDIVTWQLPDGRPHIGLVSSRNSGGVPLIIHNIGEGAREEDVLFAFQITGHYRFRLDPG